MLTLLTTDGIVQAGPFVRSEKHFSGFGPNPVSQAERGCTKPGAHYLGGEIARRVIFLQAAVSGRHSAFSPRDISTQQSALSTRPADGPARLKISCAHATIVEGLNAEC
jgi:hypothetical protein